MEQDRENRRRETTRLRKQLEASREALVKAAEELIALGKHEAALAIVDELIDQTPTQAPLREMRGKLDSIEKRKNFKRKEHGIWHCKQNYTSSEHGRGGVHWETC